MKIIIEIPGKEFDQDIADKFQDYFKRVKADMADGIMCGNYELETTDMFLASFKRMQILPDNVTNGDMFLKIHPEVVATIIKKEGYLFSYVQLRNKEEIIPFAEVYIDWWDAPYKKESEWEKKTLTKPTKAVSNLAKK